MTSIAETCRCWLITNQVVIRLDLYLFYLLVYLNHNGDILPKQETANRSLLQHAVPAITHLLYSSSLFPWLIFETSKLLCRVTGESPAAEWGFLTGSRLGTLQDFGAAKCKCGAVRESAQRNVTDIEITWGRASDAQGTSVLGLWSPYW